MGSHEVAGLNTDKLCTGLNAEHHFMLSICGPACKMTSARRLPPAWLGGQQGVAAFQACPTRGTATRGLTGALALAGRPAACKLCCGWVQGWWQQGLASLRPCSMQDHLWQGQPQ